MKIQSSIETLRTLRARIGEKIESVSEVRRKLCEYLILFITLAIIYSCYLKPSSAGAACTEVAVNLALVLDMAKFICLTGWPFALIAYLDPTWRNKDAANVFLVAYIATNAFWIHKSGCPVCTLSLPFKLFPYVLSALIGHRIGSWRQPARVEE